MAQQGSGHRATLGAPAGARIVLQGPIATGAPASRAAEEDEAGAPADRTAGGGSTSQPGPPTEPPATTVKEVVRRLAAWTIPGPGSSISVLPELSKFNGHTTVAHAKQMLEDKGVLKTEESAVGEQVTMLEWRPAFDHTQFYVNLSPEHLEAVADGDTALSVVGVHTAAMAAEMKKRGYTNVTVDFPGHFPALPPPTSTASSRRRSARSSLQIGFFAPKINRDAHAASACDQVSVMFEQHMKDDEGKMYAPLYQWTPEARNKHTGWQNASDTDKEKIMNQIRKFAHVYVFINRTDLHSNLDEELGNMSYDDLRKAASKCLPGKDTPQKDSGVAGTEKGGSGGGAKKKVRTLTHFEQACEVAKMRVEGETA